MTCASNPATMPNTSKHVQLHETEPWFGLALAPPHETESGGLDRMTCFALGLGWGRMLSLLLFSLPSQAAHGRRTHLGPGPLPSSSSTFTSHPGRVRPFVRQNRDVTQSVSRTLFQSLTQSLGLEEHGPHGESLA